MAELQYLTLRNYYTAFYLNHLPLEIVPVAAFPPIAHSDTEWTNI